MTLSRTLTNLNFNFIDFFFVLVILSTHTVIHIYTAVTCNIKPSPDAGLAREFQGQLKPFALCHVPQAITE